MSNEQQRNQESLDAAWSRPAQKTPHARFKTVAETEAAGYTWDERKARWVNLQVFDELEIHQKRLEELTEDYLAGESLDGLKTLHMTVMTDFIEFCGDTGQFQPTPDLHLQSTGDRPALTKDILSMAGILRTKVRGARRGELGCPVVNICAFCGAHPGPGKKHQRCARCQTVCYCGVSCQRAHWETHKAACKQNAANRAEAEADGVDTTESAQKEVQDWFNAVPHLHEDVAALAWQHRSEQPFFIVRGGPNARLARIERVTRKQWEAAGLQELWAHRFASSTFDANRHFFVMISRDDSRTDLPVLTPRILFPHAPPYMDAFAQAQDLRRERERAAANLPPAPKPSAPSMPAAPVPIAPMEKLETCWACRHSLPRFRFSGNQWKNGGSKRRCIECVAADKAIVADSVASMKPSGAPSTPHNNFELAIDAKGVHIGRQATRAGPPQSTTGVRKKLEYDWNCDSCNAPSRKGTECVWWTNHRVIGDVALCMECAAAGKTPDSIAAQMSCAQQ